MSSVFTVDDGIKYEEGVIGTCEETFRTGNLNLGWTHIGEGILKVFNDLFLLRLKETKENPVGQTFLRW